MDLSTGVLRGRAKIARSGILRGFDRAGVGTESERGGEVPKGKKEALCVGVVAIKYRDEFDMDTDDGWPKVWAEMSDEELRDRLRHFLFLAANSPLQHAKRIAQLVAEADKRGKADMVDEARQWVKSHEPSKQE